MATPNVGILTTTGKALIDKVNSGQAKISFSKVVFSSMDNSQLSDTQIKALTAIAPQEVVVSSPQTTLDTNSGETRIRATGTNEKLADGVYVKTYGVFAKDDTGNEILYGVTVSPNPNYFPAYDGVTPQAVTYSYKTVIQETSNITMTNSNDVYVSQEDLTEALKPLPKDDNVVHLTGNETIADQKTFDVAPIDKTTGNPYITKSGVPTIDLSNYATQQQLATKADDSKVVHDNHDNTITANGASYDLSKSDLTSLQYVSSGSFNDLPLGTVMADATLITDGPDNVHGFTTTTRYSTQWTGRKSQIAIADNTNLMYFRTFANNNWNSWTLLSDDSKVAHLSGANNFDTVPTVNNNPLLLASSLPSDLARTSQQTNFTAGLQKGGKDVATVDDVSAKQDKLGYTPANDADTFHRSPDTGAVTESGNFPTLQVKGVDVATNDDLNNYYHANASDDAALAAAKAATVPGIFWFEEA